jgi:hypothetical protein
MSNELESDRVMVVIEPWWRFRVTGADSDGVQVGSMFKLLLSVRPRPSRQVRQTRSEVMFRVTEIVRFLRT